MPWITRTPVMLVLMLVVAAGAAAQTSPARKQVAPSSPTKYVAIWDVKVVGLEPKQAALVLKNLRQAIDRSSAFRVLPEAEVKKRLKAKRVVENANLAEVAGALALPWIITGSLGGLGGEVSMDLKLLDGQTVGEARRVDSNLPADTRVQPAALDEVVARLLQPETWVGGLALDLPIEGAQVILDGNLVGTTPLGQIGGLDPGKHILLIRKEGFAEYAKFVFIRYNQVTSLAVDLAKTTVEGLLYQEKPQKPAPPLPTPAPKEEVVTVLVEEPKWGTWRTVAFWSAVGGVTLVGGGLLLGLSVNDIEHEIAQFRWYGGTGQSGDEGNIPEYEAKLNAGTRRARWCNALWISGSVIAAGSAVLFFVLDGGKPAEVPQASGPAVQPALVPGGVGLEFSGRF